MQIACRSGALAGPYFVTSTKRGDPSADGVLIGRKKLLLLLQERTRELGLELRFEAKRQTFAVGNTYKADHADSASTASSTGKMADGQPHLVGYRDKTRRGNCIVAMQRPNESEGNQAWRSADNEAEITRV